MKTFVEKRLVQIRSIADDIGAFISCDIYYDDLRLARGEHFVVRLHGHSFVGDIDVHYRTASIRRSLNMALAYMKRLKNPGHTR